MKEEFYKNYLKKAVVWLLIFVLAMPLASIAEIQSHTEQEAIGLSTRELGPKSFTGWMTENGKWCYYINGSKQYYWLYLSEGTYYLDPQNGGGRMSGVNRIRGKWYYFDPSNNDKMYKGWRSGRYYHPDGVMAVGLSMVEGVMRYFDGNGYYVGEAQGWVMENGKWYFYIKGLKQKGVLFNANNWYYLDKATGEMLTGWIKDGSNWYYAFSSGKLASGKVDLGGKTNYFDDSGVWIGYHGWQLKDGGWYYLEDGKYVSGFKEIEGSTYYFDEDPGENHVMRKGLIFMSGSRVYFFDNSGRMVKEEVVDFGGGQKYYFNWGGQGTEVIGWVYENDAWKFRMKDGRPFINGYLSLEGKRYYFDANGKMRTGWYTDMNVNRRYLLPSGEMLKNTTYIIDDVMYYFDSDGISTPAWGWSLENGKWYFYIGGKKYFGIFDYNGNTYYMGTDYSMYSGWFQGNSLNVARYFKESGAMAKNETLIIDGVSYKFGERGFLIRSGWFFYDYDNRWYYLDNGVKLTGLVDINGAKYYFDENGKMWTGWMELDSGLYYFNNSGAMAKGITWIDDDSLLCIFDEDGMYTGNYNGWYQFNGKWYYYKNGSSQRGWLQLGDKWYYLFAPDGEMAVGTVNAGGVMHVFDSNGVWQHAL